MRDMNPRGERSIRNIPVPAGHRRVQELPPDTYEEDFTERPAPRRSKKRFNFRSRFWWVALAVVVVCALGGLLLSTVFAGASITVSPRSAQVTPPGTITAQPNAPAGALAYQVITTSRTASTTVNAGGTQHVSRAATGVLTIYNEYSAQTQRLITNTRFEAPDGKIYRIHDSVDVPGYTKSADGTIVPGTATVSAFADSPGDTYNKGATQFTIPGFKGDPRYDKFYAKADSMSGGFIGDEAAVAPADLKTAQDLLKQGLEGALRTAAETQIPQEFLPIPGTLAITFGSISQSQADGGKVTISQTANASADIVRATDLAAAIAKLTVQGYSGEPVGFADNSQISLALASSTQTTGVLQLKLSGTPTLTWQFDPDALKKALMGKSKGDFEKIVQSFAPAIQCTTDTPCKASVRPFWSTTFPSNPDKITINTGQ